LHPETRGSVIRTGTLTVYNSDQLMDSVIAYRFGLNREFFFYPEVRADISNLSSVQEITSLQYWGQPLITAGSLFERMKQRIGESTMLYILQGSADVRRTRPNFIAPDTYNFYKTHPEKFIGSIAHLKTWQTVDAEGNLQDQEKVIAAWIMDVRAGHHHR